MKIETKRLLLRPFTAADGEDLYSYLSDHEVVRFEPYDVFTKADAEKEAARRAGDPNFFAVVLKKTGHVIGNLYFAPSEYEKYEFGYVLSRAYWKNGYATEAADALLRDAFAQKKLHRVEAYCHPDNVKFLELTGAPRLQARSAPAPRHLVQKRRSRCADLAGYVHLRTFRRGFGEISTRACRA